MVNRNRSVIAGVCMLFAAASRLPAQGNTADVFGGYSYTKANPEYPLAKQTMNGWVGSAGGWAVKWFGAAVEISGSFGSIPSPSGISAPNPSFKEYSYMAGPQFRFIDMKRVQTSVRFLLGGVFGQVNLASTTTPASTLQLANAGITGFNQTKFAMMLAVPIDFSLNRLIGLRVEPGYYLTDFNQNKQSNFRFSVGPVFRFGGGR